MASGQTTTINKNYQVDFQLWFTDSNGSNEMKIVFIEAKVRFEITLLHLDPKQRLKQTFKRGISQSID